MVEDWISVRRLQAHDVELLDIDDEEYKIEKIIFKNIGRVDNPNRKDICAVFRTTTDRLLSFENSETMTRLEVERYLKKSGFHGGIKNKASEKRKNPTYDNITLESNFRKLTRIDQHTYAPRPDLEYRLSSAPESILTEVKEKIPSRYREAFIEECGHD